MTAPRNTDRLIRAFLAEGETDLPDQVYDAVRREIDRTDQRVVIGLWRTPVMSSTARIALAAAAVVVVALIGYQFLVAPNVSSPGPAPSQTDSPSLAPSAAPTVALAFPSAGPLSVGRHSLTLSGVRLSIELTTEGWISNGDFGIDKGTYVDPDGNGAESAGFIFWRNSAPDNVYADPCAGTPLSPPAGPSAAELAAAVSTVPGTELVSGPSAVTIGGYPAQDVVLTVPEDIGCAPQDFNLWYDGAPPDELGRYATELGSTIYVWIIDVDGTLVWIDGETYVFSSPEAAQEVQQIIDSIRFE